MLNSKGNKRGMHNNHTKGKDNNLYKHGMRNDPLYSVWGDIKHRCYNPNNKRYKHYKDVNMCDEWLNDFPAFRKYCYANGWRKGLVIARHGDVGNYEPNNIKFITPSENTRELNARLCKKVICTKEYSTQFVVFDNQHQAARHMKALGITNGKVKTVASNIGRAILKGGKAYGYEWRWLNDPDK